MKSITILHVVGGVDLRGGIMSYVRQITGVEMPDVKNLVWKHRNCEVKDSNYVCKGWASSIDMSIAGDVLAALLDFIPLFFWVKKQKDIVLHAHSRMGIVLCVMLGKTTGTPVVVHLHAMPRRVELYHKLWNFAKTRRIFNSWKTCLHFGCDPKQSEIMMPTINWLNFAPADVRRIRFVACSSFLKWKNVHLIVQAFNQICSKKINAELHIYGLSDTPLRAQEQEHVVGLAQGNPSIHLKKWDPLWTGKLQSDDIFVHAADTEPFGIVILEAFSKGCRMVVPTETFLEHLPEPQRSEGVFPVKNVSVAALAEQMIRAAEQDLNSQCLWKLRNELAYSFSMESSALRLSLLYRSMLESSS